MFTLRPLARPPQKTLMDSLSARHSDVVWWAQTLSCAWRSNLTSLKCHQSHPSTKDASIRRKEDRLLLLLLLLHTLLRGKAAPICTQGSYDVSVQTQWCMYINSFTMHFSLFLYNFSKNLIISIKIYLKIYLYLKI